MKTGRYSQAYAFGNNMTKPLGGAGSFAWRGGEGSVSDSEPNLVHMQARHYDPTLGRFIQADSLMLASFTTQGMNRYIYTENDPVNQTDPTGAFLWMLFAMIVIGGIVGGIMNMVTAGATAEHFANGAVGGAVSGGLVFLVLPLGVGWGAIGAAIGNMLTSYLEGDLPVDVARNGGASCILGFMLLHGEKALPWGFVASLLFWFAFDLAWDYFTGGSFSLREPTTDGNSERHCSTVRRNRYLNNPLPIIWRNSLCESSKSLATLVSWFSSTKKASHYLRTV